MVKIDLITGFLGSGKTTFLNVLSDYVPDDERVITIEDSAELQLHNINNIVRLEARVANSEGTNAVSIRDLIKASLRMRPDRIVVGEVRGPEAIDMLQAMNTGHDGSLSTGHANSPKDMLTRLETMVLMGMDMPVSAIRRSEPPSSCWTGELIWSSTSCGRSIGPKAMGTRKPWRSWPRTGLNCRTVRSQRIRP